jgi:hypothetical protein
MTATPLTQSDLRQIISVIDSFYDLMGDGPVVTEADVTDGSGDILGRITIDEDNTYTFVAAEA